MRLFRRLSSTIVGHGRLVKSSSFFGLARGIAFEVGYTIFYIHIRCSAFKLPNDSVSKIASRYFAKWKLAFQNFSSSILFLSFSLWILRSHVSFFIFFFYDSQVFPHSCIIFIKQHNTWIARTNVCNISDQNFHSTVPPDILDYPTSTDMVVREGSNVSLRCEATGSPTPNITWRREDGELINLGNNQEGKLLTSVLYVRKKP